MGGVGVGVGVGVGGVGGVGGVADEQFAVSVVRALTSCRRERRSSIADARHLFTRRDVLIAFMRATGIEGTRDGGEWSWMSRSMWITPWAFV